MNQTRLADLPETTDVVVVGAGIGGLCAALALARRGLDVLLLERASRFEAVGAGIVLAANATAALAALGVDVTAFGRPLASMDVLGIDGAALTRLPLARLRAEVGPVFACHRAELHRALVARLPASVSTALGAQVTAVTQTADLASVNVTDATGASRLLQAKLVVGADGLRSAVRAHLGHDAPLRYSGETCWRAIVRGLEVDGASETWGRRTRVGVIPLPMDTEGVPRVYTFWTAHAPAHAEMGSFHDVVARFASFQGDARRVLDATRAEDVTHHDLWETTKPSWGHSRTWLLGDAAHAMTPNQGQGAAMAIEDALALAWSLRSVKELSHDALSKAHTEYAGIRHHRVWRVQRDSRRLGQLAGWAWWPLVWLRNLALRLTPEQVGLAHYRKLTAPGLALAKDTANRQQARSAPEATRSPQP